MEEINSSLSFDSESKTVTIKKLYNAKKDENVYYSQPKEPFEIYQKQKEVSEYEEMAYFIDLELALPIEFIYGPFKNNYEGHEKVSDIVTKTWKIIFEVPFKFYFGNILEMFGTVYVNNNIYFDFKPTEIQWRKWKKQTVSYDSYSHYFIYLEKEFMFSNGGYGSHMDIKATFNTDIEDGKEYALINEIQFYDVKDPDNTIRISQIIPDIFKYEKSIINNRI